MHQQPFKSVLDDSDFHKIFLKKSLILPQKNFINIQLTVQNTFERRKLSAVNNPLRNSRKKIIIPT